MEEVPRRTRLNTHKELAWSGQTFTCLHLSRTVVSSAISHLHPSDLHSNNMFFTFLLLLSGCQWVVAPPPASSSSPCSSGIYSALLVLSTYAPAESYCTSHYPQPKVTSTVTAETTITVTALARREAIGINEKRNNAPATTSTAKTTSKITSTSTSSQDANSLKWSNCLSSAASFVSTVCSCSMSLSFVSTFPLQFSRCAATHLGWWKPSTL